MGMQHRQQDVAMGQAPGGDDILHAMNAVPTLEVAGTAEALIATGMSIRDAIRHVVSIYGAASCAALASSDAILGGVNLGFEKSDEVHGLLDGIGFHHPATARALWEGWLGSGHMPPWRVNGLGRAGIHLVYNPGSWRTWLDELPARLRSEHPLFLHRWAHLESIPNSWAILGGLHFLACPGVKTLPSNMCAMKGDLNFSECVALESLPEGLWVEGDLHLHRCNALSSLPAGLFVAKRLYLWDNETWDGRIPDDARIGGGIISPSHPKTIPLSRWRELHPHGERA